MLSWLRRASSPIAADRDISRTYRFTWLEPQHLLFWVRSRRVTVDLTVRARPLRDLLAIQATLDKLAHDLGEERIDDGVICAVITGDSRAMRLPPAALRELWDAYAELNHLPKAEGGEGTPAAPQSSTSPSDSNVSPSSSSENGSST